MSNELQVFMFEDRDVRTVMVEGEPWFVAKDVCEFFGDTNYRRSVSRLHEEDKTTYPIADSLGRNQETTVVNESGLYSLLFNFQPEMGRDDGVSQIAPHVLERTEQLRKFKRWLTHEVLPSLRKHGGYIVGQEQMSQDEVMARAVLFANSRIKEMEKQIEEAKPKLEEHEALIASEDSMTITNAAKHFGLNPKIEVFAFLRKKGYLCGHDLPTQKAIDDDVLILRESIDALGVAHKQARVPVSSLPIWHRRLIPRIKAWVGMYTYTPQE